MPDIPPLRIGLETVSSSYSVFENDQVLAARQLNSVADYFDDQTRLTRVKLLGVGIACGLRVSRAGNTLKVTRGVGVTTDGDLLGFGADTVFDRFALIDAGNPRYGRFRDGTTATSAVRLVKVGETDAAAFTLDQLAAKTTLALADLVAVLFMESYVVDSDLCTATDCDNTGQTALNEAQLLLVTKAVATILLARLPMTGAQAAAGLQSIAATRADLSRPMTSLADLRAIYGAACDATLAALQPQLVRLWPSWPALWSQAFPQDPAAGWNLQLGNNRVNWSPGIDFSLQYFYDTLKDLVETWNRIVELLASDRTVCCPDLAAFPKYLVLGNVESADPEANRMAFYPSPAVSCTSDRTRHALFIGRRLDAMIRGLQWPAATLVVTASRSEEWPLEERAVPGYYTEASQVARFWRYRGVSPAPAAVNVTFRANAFTPAQVGGASFFRVQGHHGMQAADAVAGLEAIIKRNNLPFTVRTVLLGTDRKAVVKKPGIRYSDLHRFHYLLRQDVANQFKDTRQFSEGFKNLVQAGAAPQEVTGVNTVVTQSHTTLTARADSVIPKLQRSYADYARDTTWKRDVSEAITAAATFKFNVGGIASDSLANSVIRTEVATPFDTLVATTHTHWLDWLDQIIETKDQAEDDKLLLLNFAAQNPGLEHFGGVACGGTFILVHDSAGLVVADFMVPWRLADPVHTEPAEPALVPPWQRKVAATELVRITKPIEDALQKYRINTILPEIDDRLRLYERSFNTSVGLIADSIKISSSRTPSSTPQVNSDMLASYLHIIDAQQKQIELIYTKARDTTLPADQQAKLKQQALDAQSTLVNMTAMMSDQIAQSETDVSPGTDGFVALMTVSSYATKMADPAAKEKFAKVFTDSAEKNKTINANASVLMRTIGGSIGRR